MENPRAPQKDDALVVTHYRRSPQQAAMLGLEVMGSCSSCAITPFVFWEARG